MNDQLRIKQFENLLELYENIPENVEQQIDTIEQNIKNYIIPISELIKDLEAFADVVSYEHLPPGYITYKQLRVWICLNIVKTLKKLPIDPNVNMYVLILIKENYIPILDVYIDIHKIIKHVDYRMDSFMVEFLIFLTIDYDIQMKCKSKHSLSQYIIDSHLQQIVQNFNIGCEG